VDDLRDDLDVGSAEGDPIRQFHLLTVDHHVSVSNAGELFYVRM
jgi:hypothetical protein